MRSARRFVLGGAACLLVLTARAAAAAPAAAPPPTLAPAAPTRALFALIVGVNASPSPGVSPLRYADDDAARYLELYRALGARTYLLSRLDENTRRLHAQAAAEALPPRRAELRQAVEALARDIAQARAAGVRSTLYVLYAGHGDVSESGWSLTLEDGRLDGNALLSEVIERAGAEQTHVIVDACHAYMLAMPRGPGGERRPASGFVALEASSRAGHVGYLLSSSASGESHEWAGFEAGVFSHEIRSGLFGAADADGDGRVTYSEIAGFVARANEAVKGERYRPKVYARPPADGDLLLDLRTTRETELRLEGAASAAHYLLEDTRGVRLADFHGDGVTPIRLVRPPGDGALYLRRLDDNTEQSVPRTPGPVLLAALPRTASHATSRGAAQDAFNELFTLAFDTRSVADWVQRSDAERADVEAAARDQEQRFRAARLRRTLGWSAIGAGAAAAVAAGVVELSARSLHDGASTVESQRDAAARNDSIGTRNAVATGLVIGGAVAAGVGLWLLWPKHDASNADPPLVGFAASPTSAAVQAGWRF
ncbi:MAG TPA: hypothetical protein VIF57_02465 [Polyangia bacterium]|jgi:hypothetical protein